MTTDRDRERLEHLAEHLSGRSVLLRFRQPPTAGATGEAYRAADAPSLAMIDIAPHLRGEELFKVFLHETAHVALNHVAAVKPTSPAQERSGAIVLPAAHWQTEHKTDPRELAANKQAEEWQAWAEQATAKYLQPGDPWELRERLYLAALEFWRKP